MQPTLRPASGWSAVLLAAIAASAEGGQPLVTDDAAIVAPKTCQLEATLRSTPNATQSSAQPACNFGGQLEWSVGGAHVANDDAPSSSLVQLQVKTATLKDADTHLAFGISAGAMRDTSVPHGPSAFQSYFGKALASWYPRDGLELDLNVGAANTRGSGTFVLAGAALQVTVASGLQLLGEVFRDAPEPGKFQIGVRSIVVRDRLDVFASYGNRFSRSSHDQFAVVGIRLQTPAFLP
jgi:hypothetical protein